ncbi:MAG: MmgE/PrpD family protein [Paracoccaceae bacterium]|nr:MAG: MmgE/PrpD family protein [Paracoccaceae bacterium]
MEQTSTEILAHFAAGFAPADLPASARDAARNLLLDSVACALAADFGDETAVYAGFARAAGGTGSSTVIGSGERLSPLGASLLNAYQITAATVCDTYVPAHVHITPEIVPPALALAERDGASGQALLAAIAVGSEVAVRVAAGINYAVAGPRGWHMPGIVGPFGAAAAVGRLLGLTPLQMRNAMGLAGSQSAGTWASWGTPTVKFHQSRGAGSGLMAGLLAQTGFTASADILTHKDGGILNAYSDGGHPGAITRNLGHDWEFEEIALRIWPGGTPLQPTLTAAFDLVRSAQPDFGAIARVTMEVSPDVHEAHARFVQPKGTFEALLSFHFAVASALRDRSFWLTSLSPAAVGDAAMVRFMADQMQIVANPAITRQTSIVTLDMTDGRRLTARADAAKGTRGNPATIEDLRGKFHHCAAGRLSAGDASDLLDIIVGIEDQADLSRFFSLLRKPGTRRAAA